MSNLTADSTYLIKLSAQNEFGMGEFDLYHDEIRTLKSDPTYVPELGVKGITWNSISLGWNSPPEDKVENIMEYITYYKITRQTATEEVRNYFDIIPGHKIGTVTQISIVLVKRNFFGLFQIHPN